MTKTVGCLSVLFTALAATAAPQDASRQASAPTSVVPDEPGMYYDSAGELKPLDAKHNKGELVVLPRTLPPLVIVYPKDAVHIEGLRLGTESSFTLTIGTDGGGIGFSYLITPKQTEPISGRANAFRVTFAPLSPNTYIVVSEFVDKKDGKKKLTIHESFLVK